LGTSYTLPQLVCIRRYGQALVGSVIRAADHGTAKKGFVASTVTLPRDLNTRILRGFRDGRGEEKGTATFHAALPSGPAFSMWIPILMPQQSSLSTQKFGRAKKIRAPY
jgi:hypothetical protein